MLPAPAYNRPISYRSKDTRRVDDQFLDQMDQAFTGWSDPAAHLRSALENDHLELYCQPIRVLSSTGDYPMAEVLVRMREEESAMLPPGDFLPVFEHYRMMPDLDRWVVRAVAKRLRRGSTIPRFSINLSSQTLEDADFVAYVGAQIEEMRIAPGALLFEIDEADVLASPWAVELLGVALKRIGCGTLIDGFGLRSASFAPLKSMRVDFLKVDGSITRQVLSSGAADTKMRAVVRVGEALGIGIVAECVENLDVLGHLKTIGTGYAQGFGIFHPLPIDLIADSAIPCVHA
jgi:EAL domain-containing protein (putative c-di-GMP-specific phosphodiesterase class I)